MLHAPGKAIELDAFLSLWKVAVMGSERLGQLTNLALLPEDLIHRIHAFYGGEGLFQLTILATTLEQPEFMHFIEPLEYILAVEELGRTDQREQLVCSDPSLRQSDRINRLNTNVFQPSLSRKLYRAGRHHGSLVYGVGGPRILVSHPFQGRTEDIYDVYGNSVDVLTSLCLMGFRGTFHFLDYLAGLNYEIEGELAWLLWFSLIAVHSDLVIYVKEFEGDFQWAQRLEIEMTPDRVQKIVVSIPHEELTWAKKADLPVGLETTYIGEHGVVSEKEWLRQEGEHAAPFIQNYVRGGIQNDRLLVIDEKGEITQYPIDYPMYGDAGVG